MITGLSLWRLRVLLTGKEDTTAPHLLGDSIRHSVFVKGFKLQDVQNPACINRCLVKAAPKIRNEPAS